MLAYTLFLGLQHFLPASTPSTFEGTAIVHLFEWRWLDIARECETFLSKNGYSGVQVSPPTENIVVMDGDVTRPWWERYQIVSYHRLHTRSGTEQQFKEMVTRCNNVGVRIYVDILTNHMTGEMEGIGTAGTYYNGLAKEYPGVPYHPHHFHSRKECPSASGGIDSYQDPVQVRNCELVGLRDLNQGEAYVRERIMELMNKFISYGVAGFRIDAAKHMWPSDLYAIYNTLDDLRTDHGFAPHTRPAVYQEVRNLGGEPITTTQYQYIGKVTEFKHAYGLAAIFRRQNAMKWLQSWGEAWNMERSDRAIVFIDNHDIQRETGNIITFREPRLYKMATAFMCAHPYGYVRIMSSFYWQRNIQNGNDVNSWQGPPHDASFNILNVTVNPDDTCNNGWVCEHRWRQIYNMVQFRKVVKEEPLTHWWSPSDYQIAFSRGNKGFIAINNEDFDLIATIQCGVPEGLYCDVISGNMVNKVCTGKVIKVDADGKIDLHIAHSDEDPVVAIHIQAKLR